MSPFLAGEEQAEFQTFCTLVKVFQCGLCEDVWASGNAGAQVMQSLVHTGSIWAGRTCTAGWKPSWEQGALIADWGVCFCREYQPWISSFLFSPFPSAPLGNRINQVYVGGRVFVDISHCPSTLLANKTHVGLKLYRNKRFFFLY